MENAVNKQIWRSRAPTLLPSDLDFHPLRFNKFITQHSATNVTVDLELVDGLLAGALQI